MLVDKTILNIDYPYSLILMAYIGKIVFMLIIFHKTCHT